MIRKFSVMVIGMVFLAACGSLTAPQDAANTSTEGETTITQDDTTSTDNAVIAEDPTPETQTMVEDTTTNNSDLAAEQVDTNDFAAQADSSEAEAVGVAYDAPAWTSLTLTDAQTGDSFTLADFAGKTVFVEPMATWCSNCRAQQNRVMQAMRELNSDEFVFISMSVEGISDERLANYARQNGFSQQFVVATPDLLSALVNQFGRSVTNPPATPHFIIAPDGTVTDLSLGSKSADAILQQVQTVAAG